MQPPVIYGYLCIADLRKIDRKTFKIQELVREVGDLAARPGEGFGEDGRMGFANRGAFRRRGRPFFYGLLDHPVLNFQPAVGHLGQFFVVGSDYKRLSHLFAQRKEQLVQFIGIL